MPAPSLRSTIAGVGSILDFASKRKQQIAVYKQQIAVYGITFALLAGFLAVSGNTTVEDLGQLWACAKAAPAPHLSHSGNIDEADVEADIAALIKFVHDLQDQGSSCKKAVDRAEKAVEMARKAVAELRLPEKEAAKAAKVLGPVEKHPQVLKVLGVLAR
jgi:hypothetical protein